MIERIARRYEGRWMQGYARGKLRRDPAFAAIGECLKGSHLPILDVGCGVGLLEFYLREQGCAAPLHGFDFDARKVAQARRIAAANYAGIHFRVADASHAWPMEGGHVVMLDVLHYLDPAAQGDLLERAADCIAPGALCLIRETPRDGSWRFRVTQLEEMFIRSILWMKSGAIHFPTIEEIVAPFHRRGFSSEIVPLWGRTPFNSHLFILRAPGSDQS